MLAVADGRACAARAYTLRKEFNLSFLNSLGHLLESAEEVLGDRRTQALKQKFHSLDSQAQYSGFIYAYHNEVIKAIETEDVPSVKKLFHFLEEENFLIKKEKFVNFNTLFPHQKEIFKNVASFELPRDISFTDLPAEKFNRRKGLISEAFQVLSTVLPDWHEEIRALVSEIVILDAVNLNAGSSFDLFGLIYISCQYRPHKLTDTLDILIHETAHLYIYLLSSQDPLILNSPEERYESPLRKDKRPLIGNYHAAFVLARLLYVLKYLRDHKAIPSEEISYLDDLLDHYKARFLAGYELLTRYGRFTDLGHNLLESGKNLALL